MSGRRNVLREFIEIGQAIDPANPVFKWWHAKRLIQDGVLSDYLFHDESARTKQAVTVLKWRPEDFPFEFRYRIQEIQKQLAAAMVSAKLPAEQFSSVRPKEDTRKQSPSFTNNAQAWQQLELFENPTEKMFEFGYELYASPSIQALKIKSVRKRSSVIIAGQIDVDGTRFFVSEWSLDRFRNGHNDGSYLKAIESTPPPASPKQYAGLTILPNVEERSFARGYHLLDRPSKNSNVVKAHETKPCRIAAYLDTEEGRFYLSDYSLERYQKGLAPFWIREIER